MRRVWTATLLLALCAISSAQPVASRPVSLPHLDLAETLFQDNFWGDELNRRKWTQVTGVSLSDPELPAGVTFHGANLDRATLRTRTIPLHVGSGILHFELTVDPATTGAFRIEFRDAAERWVRLAEVAPHESMDAPVAYQQPLPLAALHAQGAFRFRAVGLASGGRWHLQRVRVVGFAERALITADIAGPDWGWLGIYDQHADDQVDFAVPLAQAFPVGQPLALIAPPEIDHWQFNHWTIGDQIEPLRLLPLELHESTEVVAHYWPASGNLVPLRITADIPASIVDVRLPGGPPLVEESPGTYRLRRGDIVEVVPASTPQHVFLGWRDGGLAPRRWTMDGPVDLHARYGLRGDLNGDGTLDKLDVDALIHALADPDGYRMRFPNVPADIVGDFDGDGRLTEDDVDPFVGRFFE